MKQRDELFTSNRIPTPPLLPIMPRRPVATLEADRKRGNRGTKNAGNRGFEGDASEHTEKNANQDFGSDTVIVVSLLLEEICSKNIYRFVENR